MGSCQAKNEGLAIRSEYLGTVLCYYGRGGLHLRFTRFLDYLLSLDGREYLVACCLLRRMTYTEITKELRCSRSTVSRLKKRLVPEWQEYVEEVGLERQTVEGTEASQAEAEQGSAGPTSSGDNAGGTKHG